MSRSSKAMWVVTAAIVIIIIILIYFNSKKTNIIIEQKNNQDAIADTLHVKRDSDSLLLYTIAGLKNQSKKDFLEIKTRDSEIHKLQELVADYKGQLEAAATFTTEGNVNTVVVTKTDTSTKKWPVYNSEINLGKWVNANISAGQDSTHLKLNFIDEYDLTIGTIKGKTYGDIKPHNPYNTVKTFRTFNVGLPKPKRWGIGLDTGYGIILAGHGNVYHGWIGGATISYHFVEF